MVHIQEIMVEQVDQMVDLVVEEDKIPLVVRVKQFLLHLITQHQQKRELLAVVPHNIDMVAVVELVVQLLMKLLVLDIIQLS